MIILSGTSSLQDRNKIKLIDSSLSEEEPTFLTKTSQMLPIKEIISHSDDHTSKQMIAHCKSQQSRMTRPITLFTSIPTV